MPKIRSDEEKERFYTGFNRYDVEPEEMLVLLKEAIEEFPDKRPTNRLHAKFLQLVLKYEKGFTANPNRPPRDFERFSWILGAKLQASLDLHDRLAKAECIHFDGLGDESNYEFSNFKKSVILHLHYVTRDQLGKRAGHKVRSNEEEKRVRSEKEVEEDRRRAGTGYFHAVLPQGIRGMDQIHRGQNFRRQVNKSTSYFGN